MKTFVVEERTLHIPAFVHDLSSFRRWFHSDEFPKTGRVCFLRGELWVDMSKEQIFSHNQVKQEFNAVLGAHVKKRKLGRYFPDGILFTNLDADLSVQPDGTFVSEKRMRSGAIQMVEGTHEGYLELQGVPDMVLEVVSTSSVVKDTETLMELYWEAGIPEYWLADARGDSVDFDIFRHTPEGYESSRTQTGWAKSTVFGKLFRLTVAKDELGNLEYSLALR